jgi:predicted kinase
VNATLVLVAGPAGAGKSFVAGELARRVERAVILDKDTLTAAVVEQLLTARGLSAYDRESPIYVEHVRPLEYRALMAAAYENLAENRVVLAVAPFTRELDDAAWIDQTRKQTQRRGAALGLVWVRSDAATTAQRMGERAAPRDAWKLANWTRHDATVRYAPPPFEPRIEVANVGSDPSALMAALDAAAAFVRSL